MSTDYLGLLDHSYEIEKAKEGCPPETRFAFLSEHIFDFTTYDGAKDELFGRKAVEVCAAISEGKTFEYIKDEDNYTWFLLMCNMPFFARRLEWGSSIRGAWWAAEQPGFRSYGLWVGEEQITDVLRFGKDEWECFMAAVVEWASK